MLIAERNRLEHAVPAVQHGPPSIFGGSNVSWRMSDLDLDDAIQASPVWRAKENLLRSTPGVSQHLASGHKEARRDDVLLGGSSRSAAARSVFISFAASTTTFAFARR